MLQQILITFIICMVFTAIITYVTGHSSSPVRRSDDDHRHHRRPRHGPSRSRHTHMEFDESEGSHRHVADTSKHHGTDPSASSSGPISFYHRDEPYYEFTNFSPYPITFEGQEYPTAEHLFQAHKFLSKRRDLAERIRSQSGPRAALQEGTRLNRLRRSDWFEVNIDIMDEILEAKFTQHSELRDLLLSTGDREIIEASPVDAFWGAGEDNQGRNELGKALMRLRERLGNQVAHDERLTDDPEHKQDISEAMVVD